MAHVIQDADGTLAYKDVIDTLLAWGERVTPRGMPCREMADVSVVVGDARRAVPMTTTRRVSPMIGATEYAQLLAGVSCLEQLDLASGGRFSQFADEGRLAGAYGPRIWLQLARVARLLSEDSDSRQGTLAIWCGSELSSPSRDVPCTVALMFKIRHGLLNLTAVMRSSDAWLGIPYDWWQFSRLQMTMAWALGMQPGRFTFFASSLHLYDRNIDAARCLEFTSQESPEIPAITARDDLASTPDARIILAQEAALKLVRHDPDAGALASEDSLEFYARYVPAMPDGFGLCDRCRYIGAGVVHPDSCARCQKERREREG